MSGLGTRRAALLKRNPTALEIAKRLGLTTGLQLCLDAGDRISYGSGQSWLDRSGNGYDFFLGADSSATSTDPTFNSVGDLGRQSDWSFDGGDRFTYDSANETWMNNIHKDGYRGTMAGWVNPADFTTTRNNIAGTNATTAAEIGFVLFFNTPNGEVFLQSFNGLGAQSGPNINSVAQAVAGAWNFFAIQVNESAGTGHVNLNGVIRAETTTYTSPSASDATDTMALGSGGDGSLPLHNGSRMAMFWAWDGVDLTEGNTLALFNATRGRFGK